jgi:hypothetical protein
MRLVLMIGRCLLGKAAAVGELLFSHAGMVDVESDGVPSRDVCSFASRDDNEKLELLDHRPKR